MNKKILKLLINWMAIFVLMALLLRGCTYVFWSEWDIDKTLNFFQQNQASFNSLVEWVSTEKSQNCLKKYHPKICLPQKLQNITQADFLISYKPLMIEAAPINFYYVLVYAASPETVTQSYAYQDEGKIIKKIDKNWTLVRRGWM